MKSGLMKVLVASTLLGMGAGSAYADASDNGIANANGNGNDNPHGWTNNPYSPAYDHPYRHGVMPTREVNEKMKAWEHAQSAAFAAPTASTGQLSFGGGVNGVGVLSGQSKVYLIFYGTQWGTQSTDANGNLTFSNDAAGAAVKAQMMFKGIGTGAELWSAELTQWCDGPTVANGATSCPATGAQYIPYQQNIFAGAWYDNSAASPSQATGTQLAQEAIKAATHFGNTAAGSNRYTYYVILSPTGTNPDNYKSPTQGYCAWHDYTGDGYGVSPTDIAFSNQPYNIDVGSSCGVNFVNSGSAGTLDGYTMTLGHEWHEMMSDQFPAGGWTNHTGGSYNGQENSDECAWIAAGQQGGAANVVMGNGTYTEQASWSNDTGSCAISHPIVTHGGGGGNVAPTANFNFVTSGLTATFTDTSSDSDGTIASRSWTFGDGGTSTATNPSHTYASAGTYSVKETVTDNGGLTGSVTKSVTVTSGSTVLSNGVPVTGLAATTGNKLNYTMVVPAGATNLKFTISGGTGDADMYVKFGAAPTTTTYDCRPYVSGNSETCTMSPVQAGTYYVMLNAYASFTGVTLTGSYTAPGSGGTPTANFTFTTSGLTATFTDTSTDSGGTIGSHSWTFGDGGTSTATSPSHTYAAAGTYSVTETVTDSVNSTTSSKTSSVTVSTASCGGTVLCSGVAVALASQATGTVSPNYTMVVPAGKTSVVFTISGGTGDADLYVKLGSAPTTTSYTCRPYLTGNSETCTISNPTAGTYYVNVRAYAAYSGVSLKGTISP
ncbi:MAG TPA: pre-peptidase C-terminal domain-containing protein [Rhodanobacteraceae bacterium]|nr:pre-peptidase C-terminal domain-containing protein [Rhodanobacteraceae bacterium]